MKKVLHIIYKSTNSVDYILPFFYKKKKEKEFDVTYLAWDFSPEHLKKNLPNIKFFSYKFFSIWDFLDKNFQINSIKNTFYLKRIYFSLINNFFFLLNKNKLKDFLSEFDNIYIDCRELISLPYLKNFCEILKFLNKKIIFVPHSPHYTTLVAETSYSHSIYFKNSIKQLIMSTKKSKPWKDLGGFKKKECIYMGLPCRDKNWLKSIKHMKKKKIFNKSVGFLFRPFDRNFSKFFLKLRKGDDYINTFHENSTFIELAKILKKKGFKIFFRLHPSSKSDAFRKFYKKQLGNLKYEFGENTIHEFFFKCENIVSFTSSSLIYGCYYNSKIFLKTNHLTNKIWSEWIYIKKVYQKFSIFFSNNDEFLKIFFNKKIKKYNNNKILNMLW